MMMVGLILLKILILNSFSLSTYAAKKESVPERGDILNIQSVSVVGTVVAYDIGLVLADGSCRQTIIVRVKDPGKQKQKSEYIIVRYENSCMKMLPERLLKTGPQWHFSLTRNADCDQSLNDLLYFKQLSPTGELNQLSRVKLVPGRKAEKIPVDKKLPCYGLWLGDFEPLLKERLVTGVVLWSDGRPVVGAYVYLKYADADPYLIMVRTDENGRFAIPVFEGFRYAVQATVSSDRPIYGELVQIPTAGKVQTLKLVIK